MNRAFIGIDPGLSGGIGVTFTTGDPIAYKMPETERDLWDTIKHLSLLCDGNVVAAIERVHAMPRQGVSSCFTFGRGYGSLRMALIASGIPFLEVTPQTWQKELRCLTRGDKNVSKSMAQQVFPMVKVTHAIADALLLAEWRRRQP